MAGRKRAPQDPAAKARARAERQALAYAKAKAAGGTRFAQYQYNQAERSAYLGFVAQNGPVKGGQKGFRALLKARGWAVPHHYAKKKANQAQAQREQAFLEEGLGRQGTYYAPKYPEASETEDGEA